MEIELVFQYDIAKQQPKKRTFMKLNIQQT